MRNVVAKCTAYGLFVLLLFSFSSLDELNGQSNNNSASARELYDQIAALDSAMFDAFNRCDIDKVASFFTEDLEFYHEKAGLTATRTRVIETMKANLCSKNSNRVRRELIRNTLEVTPINNYGAVQTGEHRFYLTQAGLKEQLDGIGKFVQIWQKRNGEWKISRVISYGFRPPE